MVSTTFIKRGVQAVAIVVALLVPTFGMSAELGTHLKVSNLKIAKKNRLSTTEPYLTRMNIETQGGVSVNITKMCFLRNKDGPHCFDQWEMQKVGGRSVPTIALTTGNPGSYTLTGFLLYRYQGRTYYTNQLRTKIRVR